MQTIKLEGKLLKQVAGANSTAEVVATSLALRERLRHFSDIRRTKMDLIKSGEKIVDSDYKKFWKDLEALGVGSIVYGRKGNPDRFEWHYNLKSVASAAIEGKDLELTKINFKPMKLSVAPIEIKRNAPIKLLKPEFTERNVYIMLRDGISLNLKVPVDLTRNEINLIIRALSQVS